jgi:hypothetical protein
LQKDSDIINDPEFENGVIKNSGLPRAYFNKTRKSSSVYIPES